MNSEDRMGVLWAWVVNSYRISHLLSPQTASSSLMSNSNFCLYWFCYCPCVYMPVCEHGVYAKVCVAVQTREYTLMNSLCLLSLGQGVSLNLELSGGQKAPVVLCPHPLTSNSRNKGAQGGTRLFLCAIGSELAASYFHSKCSHPLSSLQPQFLSSDLCLV